MHLRETYTEVAHKLYRSEVFALTKLHGHNLKEKQMNFHLFKIFQDTIYEKLQWLILKLIVID